jgi:hypothetical protein
LALIKTRGFPRRIYVTVSKSSPEITFASTVAQVAVECETHIFVGSASVSLGTRTARIDREAA